MSAIQDRVPAFLKKFMKNNQKKKIKFGIPWEYLKEGTIELLKKAGYNVVVDEHSFQITIDDPEIECFTGEAEEIALWVGEGIVDVGISEEVFVLDNKLKVVYLADLNFGYKTWKGAEMVLAVPDGSRFRKISDLAGKKIATWVPRLTKDYFKKNKVAAEIIRTTMPAEQKCPSLFDAVVEFVNTGTSLEKFNLKVLVPLMQTSPWLIANENSLKDNWKKKKIDDLTILLKGARLAKDMVGLMLHASNKIMERVFEILPSMKKPTVTQLRGENWFDILTVADKKDIRRVIPKLKKIGCTDIVEFPLDKVVL